MNSKECLYEILGMLNYEQVDECDKKDLLRIIKQDLDKLEQLEKALDILKEKLEIQLHQDDEYFPIPMISGSEIFQNLTKEEYKLLKEVLE